MSAKARTRLFFGESALYSRLRRADPADERGKFGRLAIHQKPDAENFRRNPQRAEHRSHPDGNGQPHLPEGRR